MAASLGDYYNILEFTQGELKESRQQLAKIRNEPDRDKEKFTLEHEIALLEQGVDRFQKQIKVLQQTNPHPPCSPSIL